MKTKIPILALIVALSIAVIFSCAHRRPFPPEIITVTGSGYATPTEAPAPVRQAPAPEALAIPDWSGKEIEAVGHGAPPAEAANAAQSRLMAKLAARRDAQRNLAETLNGVQIDSKTTVRNFITESDEIRSKVEGFLRGFRTVEEKESDDGTWEVRIALPLEPLREIVQAERAGAKSASQPVRVTGRSPLSGQDRLLARRAAETDARRKLLEYVKGARIDSYTTVEDFMTKDDRIRSQVSGLIAGARVVDTRYFDDGTCEVDIQFDLSQVKNLVR